MKSRAFSHSSLSTFETCPKKYYYAYICDRVEGKVEDTIEAFLGKRVHETLELLYKNAHDGDVWSVEHMLNVYESLWGMQWKPNIRVVSVSYPVQHYQDLGRKCLTDYYKSHYPFTHNRLIATERKVQIKLDDEGKFKMVGIVDRIDEVSPGILEVHDYKTGKKLPTQAECDKDRQLAAYSIGVKDMYPDTKEITLVWHYLQHDKDIRSSRTIEQLDALRTAIIGKINIIQQATEAGSFGTRTSRLCDWCEFKPDCPAFKKTL